MAKEELLEMRGTVVELLPNLLAVGFVLVGLLGDGATDSTRFDPQAKTLAEYVRSRFIDVPSVLLELGFLSSKRKGYTVIKHVRIPRSAKIGSLDIFHGFR